MGKSLCAVMFSADKHPAIWACDGRGRELCVNYISALAALDRMLTLSRVQSRRSGRRGLSLQRASSVMRGSALGFWVVRQYTTLRAGRRLVTHNGSFASGSRSQRGRRCGPGRRQRAAGRIHMRAARARVRFGRDQYRRNRVSVVVQGASRVSRLWVRECLKLKSGDRGASLATRLTLEEHARTWSHRVPHGSTASSAGKILLDGVERCCTLLSGAGSREQRWTATAVSRLRGFAAAGASHTGCRPLDGGICMCMPGPAASRDGLEMSGMVRFRSLWRRLAADGTRCETAVTSGVVGG